ncbi:23S rRNA (uracil1939-C5)-methyltransferase [Mariprofundus micogutta]|uniref:23S rRNA (Uracil1939-C5)-methyltransferase n=1 Tax=Mariprofundus micogutta TaxID=1921010 RepID=A0A1L8CJP0_9PROT|nr:methyltransferase [Mariprofundus micogutta]GAV19105.1 23S rRNA (uracil1939-C5)-methyltransferase [Mariprofundus micogutta]
MIATGDSVQARVEKVLPGGDSSVRVQGETILVANAVPGDLIDITVTDKRRGVYRGEITNIVEASSERIQAPCSVAAQCGGCAMQFMPIEQQAALKSSWVEYAFRDISEADTDFIAIKAEGDMCRRRVRWFVGSDDQGYFLGFYAQATHQAVRHAHCMVVTQELNAVRKLIESDIALDTVNSVQAVQLHDGMHIIIETDSAPVIDIESLDELALQWWWRDAKRITRPLKKPAKQFHDLLPAGDTSIALTVGPDDFVQGQHEGNQLLIRQIQQWAGPVRRVADLFCGIGNLSLPLAASTGATVFGAELNAASIRAASKNSKTLKLNAQFEVANLFEAFALAPYIGADVLILDPPRRGAKRVCNQVSRLLPQMIIMVSCDPAAGARDAAILKQQGYRMKALRALDLFPYAGHVEAMSLWVKS